MGRNSNQPKRERVVLSGGRNQTAEQRDRRVEAVRRTTAENDVQTAEKWKPRS